MSKQPRIFSGIQPTGNLHIGNYLGAVQNWVRMQEEFEDCIFCVVDLHAITVPQDPAALRQHILETVAAFIAAGIDTKKATLFAQSGVVHHTELAWMLNCHTPLGWLNRMTQFKEKAGKHREQASTGLYTYPVLMAADILVYDTTHVPVGEDQKQHLELARDIAISFNHHYEQEIFTVPEPMITGVATRVMSLRDGTKKMSKSDPSDYSRITLKDDADTIAQKIRKAKTDPEPLPSEEKGLEERAEARNLVNIFAAFAEKTPAEVLQHYGGQTFSVFKNDLAELATSRLAPINTRMAELLEDKNYLNKVLTEGAEKATKLAAPTVKRVQHSIGLWAGG